MLGMGRLLDMSIRESGRRRADRTLEGDSSKAGKAELGEMRDALDGVLGRLERLEEERDFYKALLDSPKTRGEIPPPAVAEDASEIGPE